MASSPLPFPFPPTTTSYRAGEIFKFETCQSAPRHPVYNILSCFSFFYHSATAPSGSASPHYRGSTITLRHTTLVNSPSACRRDLYLSTHNTHNRQTSMSSVEFEHTIPGSERPQTHALDRAATGIGPASLKSFSNSLDSSRRYGDTTRLLDWNTCGEILAELPHIAYSGSGCFSTQKVLSVSHVL